VGNTLGGATWGLFWTDVVFEWRNLVYLQPLQKHSELVGQNVEV